MPRYDVEVGRSRQAGGSPGGVRSLAAVLSWAWWLLTRGWVVVPLIIAVLAIAVGLPHLRVSWEGRRVYHTTTMLSCRYAGPLGVFDARPGLDVYETCPVVIFLPTGDWRYRLWFYLKVFERKTGLEAMGEGHG